MISSELRIGNYVTDGYYDTFKTIIKVESINEQGINLLIEDDGKWAEISDRWIEPEYRFNLLFGIPLTEEWLLKFGFESDGLEWWNGVIMLGVYKDGLYYCPTEDLSYRLGKEFKYVHQLQNLHHALTDSELIIK